MSKSNSLKYIIAAAAVICGVLLFMLLKVPSTNGPNTTASPTGTQTRRVDFFKIHGTYAFSADIPVGWQVTYISATDALNIYDPQAAGENQLEQSQIFIRNFQAQTFLTLSTVNVFSRQETELQGRPAVRYEIEKKPGVAPFSGQPAWRSERHRLIDVRYSSGNPSLFYVIAQRPSLSDSIFEEFLASIRFADD